MKPEAIKEITRAVAKHGSHREAAAELGISVRIVRFAMRRAGPVPTKDDAPAPEKRPKIQPVEHLPMWRKFIAKDRKDPGDIVTTYLSFIDRQARRAHRRYHKHYTFEEILSAAAEGCIKAARKFDPERGTKFEVFASPHVGGCIIDMVRSDDRLSRGDRRIQKQLTELDHEGATDHDRATAAGVTEETAIRVSSGHVTPVSQLSDHKTLQTMDTLTTGTQSPSYAIESEEWWRKMMFGLSLDEQTFLWLKFRYSLSGREIARLTDKSESRVSQIVSVALQHIKNMHGDEGGSVKQITPEGD